MDIPAGSIPPWTGLDCRSSCTPVLAPLSLQWLPAAPPARIARIIACSQRPARSMEKLPRRHQNLSGAYRLDCCHVHIIVRT